MPALGEEDFFAELLADEPDKVITLIQETAAFLRKTRTATAPPGAFDPADLNELSLSIEAFAEWYEKCGVEEGDTGEIIGDLQQFKSVVDEARKGPPSCEIAPNIDPTRKV